MRWAQEPLTWSPGRSNRLWVLSLLSLRAKKEAPLQLPHPPPPTFALPHQRINPLWGLFSVLETLVIRDRTGLGPLGGKSRGSQMHFTAALQKPGGSLPTACWSCRPGVPSWLWWWWNQQGSHLCLIGRPSLTLLLLPLCCRLLRPPFPWDSTGRPAPSSGCGLQSSPPLGPRPSAHSRRLRASQQPLRQARPRLQPPQAGARWRRRWIREQAGPRGPGQGRGFSATRFGGTAGQPAPFGFPWCFLPAAADPAHSGAGFSPLPASSKQSRRDFGGAAHELGALLGTRANRTRTTPCSSLSAPCHCRRPTRAHFLPLPALGKQKFLTVLGIGCTKRVPVSFCAAGSRRTGGCGVRAELRSQCAQVATGWRERPPTRPARRTSPPLSGGGTTVICPSRSWF